MYAKLMLWAGVEEYKLLLLPYEKRNQFRVEDWICYMEKGCIYTVMAQPIALAYGEYVVREWMSSRRTYNSLHLAKKAVNRMLKYELNVCWTDGVVEAGMSQLSASNGSRLAALQLASLMRGRQLLYSELQSLTSEQGHMDVLQDWRTALQRCIVEGSIQVSSSVQLEQLGNRQARYCCLRCYERQLEHASSICIYCGEDCFYCKECIVMGRSRTCGLLLIGRYQSPLLGEEAKCNAVHPSRIVQLERYDLSPAQQRATKAALSYIYTQNKRYLQEQVSHKVRSNSEKKGLSRKSSIRIRDREQHHDSNVHNAVAFVKRVDNILGNKLQQFQTWRQRYNRNFLIWAVTGAGKTEMIFPLIEYVTKQGGKVLLATPRRDVVLELDPRLRKAFPELTIVTLYGGSSQRWQEGQLVLATTHQLMRFQQAFELVIIDELDAFPYHGDPRLYRVATQCSKLGGIRILLSATPPRQLQQAMNARLLSYVLLPVRYHRHPLPVPTMLTIPSIAEQLRKSNIPTILLTAMKQSIERGAQLFVFVQRIAEAEPYVALLQRYFQDVVIGATSSKDDRRTEKVSTFRQRHIRILVTTTILERGVTIPQSDVYICDADGSLFDESSLVQMAGRAGRSADDPKGKVYFAAKHRNEAQLRAVKQIVRMNNQARKERYLLEQYW
ncbi:DEAD/DEAH box helicase [Paenibacillus endoradicis]|uniref:DEAD/DEAH box helicase n=1 Tax=Paenibacillus endoradicis TaxID=2972487 RepID=UPI0021591B66|nr:helicase-related protein [Paenibacillus endoradicis]MCR8660497.1 helicase-related protein [Paenibacillus endoradicis]